MQSVGDGYLRVPMLAEVSKEDVERQFRRRDVANFAPERLDDEEGFEVNMHYKQFPTSTILKFNSDVKFYNYHNDRILVKVVILALRMLDSSKESSNSWI